MTTRPHSFQPPDAPDVPVPPPPAVLGKGTGTRSIGDRLRFWRALFGLVLACGAVLYGAAKAIEAGLPAPDVLFWAALLEVGFGAGVVWVALTLRQDLAQFRAMLDLWNIQLTGMEAGYKRQRASRRAWDTRWSRPPVVQERVIPIRRDGDGARARVSGELHQTAPDCTSAPAVQSEHPTQALPQLPPAPPPILYHGTPEELIVTTLAAGGRCSERNRPGNLTKPAYQAAVSHLVAGEVLVPGGRGQGPQLAPALARLAGDPDLLHSEVARLLGAAR